jgi:large subunit ribosomal protein L35Ae
MAKEVKTAQKKSYHKTQPVRLYQKGVFTGFRRGKTTQSEQQAIVHVENCSDLAGARWYLGKRVAYIHKAKNTVNNTRYRVQWGKVVRTHGHAGAVRCHFAKNLPPRAMGATIRVMLYPNKTV